MTDDLQTPLETPDEGIAPEQESDSDSGAEQPVQPAPPPKYDLHQDPTFRQIQSERDRYKHQTDVLAGRVQETQNQLNTLVETIKGFDPESAAGIQAQMQVNALVAENNRLTAELNQRNLQDWDMNAVSAGVDTNTAAYRMARRLLENGDATGMLELMAEAREVKAKPAPRPAAPIQPVEEEPTMTAPKQPSKGYAAPPQGRPATPSQEQKIRLLKEERQQAIAELRRGGRYTQQGFYAIRDRFKARAVAEGIDPSALED